MGSKLWPLTTRYVRRTSSLGRSSRGAEGECGCRGDSSPQGKASLQSGGDAGGRGTWCGSIEGESPCNTLNHGGKWGENIR